MTVRERAFRRDTKTGFAFIVMKANPTTPRIETDIQRKRGCGFLFASRRAASLTRPAGNAPQGARRAADPNLTAVQSGVSIPTLADGETRSGQGEPYQQKSDRNEAKRRKTVE